ncbi:MAG: SPFH domain-containing protein [Eubacteriales bacterium]|nr:SPFH domain-containing protein [Eubacteriales bacterium]
MGLFNFIKSQLIDVIEWKDPGENVLVYRYPMNGKEIMMGAKLTVRESQAAIFVNEGKIADVFSAGLYTLSTENMPLLTKLQSWKYGFNSPFKSEVYFVNTRQYTDQKWGTTNPVMMRDAEFGMLRLRAFGIYAFRVADPTIFLREVFGTQSEFSVDAISGQLRNSIVSSLSDLLGEIKIPALDLAAQYDELSSQLTDKMQPLFGNLGFQLASLFIQNISLPEDVEKAIDARSKMGVLGDLNKYAQLQTAEAIGKIADKPASGSAGGVDMAGLGVGLGVGQTIAATMAQSMAQANAPQATAAVSQESATTIQGAATTAPAPAMNQANRFCMHCGKPIPREAKFCPECGQAQA